MNDLLARLLNLQSLPSGEGVSLGFERPMPAWAWVGVAALAVAVALWSYRALAGPAWARMSLATLRAAILFVLVLLIAGPRFVESSETTERDWVVVLADRSASMTVADATGGRSGRRTRDDQLRDALRASWPMWQELAREREVVWLGFDAGAYDLKSRTDSASGLASVDLGDARGRRTAVGAALEQALRRAAARPLSGVVLLSDGRSADELPRGALRQLQADRVPVIVAPLGSAEPVGDWAIRRADGPGIAFVNDAAPVTVEVERVGGAGEATIRLSDASTGITLAEKRIEAGADAATTATLITTPADAGKTTWVVEIVPDGGDLIPANNRAELAIELTDRPMRVLYVDGYPRWEHRYLKNLLIRERSIVSSNLLLAPDRRYTQEGDVDVVALPDSPEKWAEFDAVILGDVDPAVFTRTQLEQLREHVAGRGGGLLWIAGAGAVPGRWFDTPLADLLPISLSAGAVAAWGEPVLMRPAPAAERLGVLRLADDAQAGWPDELSDPATGWSALRWAQRIDPSALKPAVEPLAFASSAAEPDAGAAPIVLTMRFGAGRSVYVATDEIWRWRFGRGERLPERFWIQVIRLMGRESLGRAGRPAILTLSPRRSVVDQPVRIELEILDQSLVDAGHSAIALRLERAPRPGEEETPGAVELSLRAQPAGEARPGAATGERRFSAIWLPAEPGNWTAKVIEPGLGSLGLTAEAVVAQPDDELRRPEADHDFLVRLAGETGGAVIQPADLSTLPDSLPNRRVRLLRERYQTLWDTPAALIAVVLLLTLEWVGRKVIRLI